MWVEFFGERLTHGKVQKIERVHQSQAEEPVRLKAIGSRDAEVSQRGLSCLLYQAEDS